jgi:hypothetical protein
LTELPTWEVAFSEAIDSRHASRAQQHDARIHDAGDGFSVSMPTSARISSSLAVKDLPGLA